MNLTDNAIIKHIFYYILRWGENTQDNFMSLNLTCKQWHTVLNLQIQDANSLKFDNIFGSLLDSIVHNFDLPSFKSYFEYIIKYYSGRITTDIIPIDSCVYCGKLRYLLDEESWCYLNTGCHKWICIQRIDTFDDRCIMEGCSAYLPDEEMIMKHAYYIYLMTGRDDALANYYEARAEYT
jgi:hypothetical protein